MANDKMVWIDIETTGLEPDEDVMLELGMTITDKFGGYIDSAEWLVGSKLPYYDKAIERGRENEIVNEMHTMNGLWVEWEATTSDPDLTIRNSLLPRNVETDALGWLWSHQLEAGVQPMCGASIGSLDRPFLKVHMPKLFEFFHYRIVDVSTIRHLAGMLNPDIGQADPNTFEGIGKRHRVLYDIDWSIHEYKHYVENFFFVSTDD